MHNLRDSILFHYLQMVCRINFPESVNLGDKINLRCNICGDSKKSKVKKRAWLVYLHNKWMFRCWNCGHTSNAEYWLKKHFYQYYMQYIKDFLRYNEEPKEDISEQFKVSQIRKAENKVTDYKDVAYFKKLDYSNDSIFQEAISVCLQRKIPKSIYSKWFVAIDGRYKNRLIIPIYNKKNKIVWWHGRTLVNKDPKYLNCLKPSEKAFNALFSFIDTEKPIIVVESYIDSLFINNCVPTFTTNWSSEVESVLSKYQCYYLIDLDSSDETKKKCKKLIDYGKKVFNWNLYIMENNLPKREKWDINDLYLHLNRETNFDFSDFEKYFTSDFYDKFYFM